MIIFVNVGKTSNLAQSLLLYIQKNRFYRKFASRFFHNSQDPKAIPETTLSANSVNFCKFAENPYTKLDPNPMNNLNNSTKNEPEMGQHNTLLIALRFLRTITTQKGHNR